jgi:hypothetical protein
MRQPKLTSYGYVDTLDEGRDHGDTPEQND